MRGFGPQQLRSGNGSGRGGGEGTRARDLLENCTTDQALLPFAVDLVTDVFPSLGALAGEAVVFEPVEGDLGLDGGGGNLDDELQPGLCLLRDELGAEVVDGMVAYWREEWAVD